ncbi:hypothetical protein V6Z11_A10G028900 [Gossypium hirsutum]
MPICEREIKKNHPQPHVRIKAVKGLEISHIRSIDSCLVAFALIATSSILLISVPVVFASPYGWLSNKNIVFSGTSLWIGLVFPVGIFNCLIS